MYKTCRVYHKYLKVNGNLLNGQFNRNLKATKSCPVH